MQIATIVETMVEPASKKRRTSPAAFRFMDLPVDVIRLIQDKAYDATTRLRLQSVIPKAMWSLHETDSTMSLIEYANKRGILAEHKMLMEFLYARTEASARDILESMAGFPAFIRGKNLLADIAAERLRDPAELPTAQDIETDFYVSWSAIHDLGGRSIAFFDKFVATDMFGHMKRKFTRGGIKLYREICRAKNEALYHRVLDLARDDPWFICDEKDFDTHVFEAQMNGDRDADVLGLFETAVSHMNLAFVRSTFDRVSKIPV
jgi:hypothetical protein